MQRLFIPAIAIAVCLGLWSMTGSLHAEEAAPAQHGHDHAGHDHAGHDHGHAEAPAPAEAAEAQAAEAAVETAEAAESGEAEGDALAEPDADAFDAELASYAIGLDIADSLETQIESQGLALSTEHLIQGLKDGRGGGEPKLDEQQRTALLNQLSMQIMKAAMDKAAAEGDANLAACNAFLAENAKQEGVVTTESGLQYKIIEKGEGTPPKLGDTVTVHYRGELIDGTMFDSSKEPPQPGRQPGPTSFTLGEVIKGWNEGLTHIAPGGKIMLYIPPHLGYGPQPMGPIIGPNSALVFEVELLSVERADG